MSCRPPRLSYGHVFRGFQKLRRSLVNPVSDRADKGPMGEMGASGVWNGDASSGLSPASSNQMVSIIHRACLTAYLLLGNFKQAEAATLQGIDLWDAASGKEGLFDKVLTVAVEMGMALRGSASGEPFVDVESWLPFELTRVLNLPQPPRSCYVLRVLAGIPAESCGRVMALQPATVNQLAVSAMTALSSFRIDLTKRKEGRET